MVVNARGRMYTQRVEPKLALIQVELPIEAFTQGWEPDRASFLGEFLRFFLFFLDVVAGQFGRFSIDELISICSDKS